MFRNGCQTMLLLLIPVLLIIWGFWWIHKPPAYPKDPDNMGYFFIGYRTQWALKSPDTWLYSHVRYGRWMVGLGLVTLILTVVGVFLLPADKVERTLLAMYVTALIIPYVPIERGLRRCYDRYGRRIDER